jgi:hypothetical protein
MNEIDRIGSRAADAVRAQAAAVAATDHQLDEATRGTAQVVQIAPRGARRRIMWRLGVGVVAAAAVVVGLVYVTRDRESASVVSPPPTSAAETVPATTPTSTSPTATTVPDTAGQPPIPGAAQLEHGLFVGFLPIEVFSVQHVEAMGSGTERARYVAVIRLIGSSGVQVTLSDELVDPEGADANGDNSAAGIVVRQLQERPWLRVEIIHDFDPATNQPIPTAVTFDDLRKVAASITYDPAEDHRTTPMASGPQLPPAQCAGDVSTQGGGPDMVLFTCDGTLAIYSGSTGQQTELIQQFDDPRIAHTGEGDGPPIVDGVAVSPDGSTVYFSTGPEPVAGNLFRYVVGSGAVPDFIGYGYSPAVSPNGDRIAVVFPDGIGVSPTTGGDPITYSLHGMFAGDLAWAPDGERIAFTTTGGVIGVLEPATGDVTLYGSAQQGMRYYEPWFDPDRGLMALGACCGGGAGDTVDFVVVGDRGNSVPPEANGSDESSTPLSFVRSWAGLAVPFIGDRLGPPGQPWATGVLEAALLAP